MSKVEKIEKRVAEMRANPCSVGFSDALKVADHYFRQFGESLGRRPSDQPSERQSGDAKPYQVRQVIAAIDKLTAIEAPETE